MSRRIGDLRLLKLIRLMLKAGVMEAGLFRPTKEGVPQGSIVCPLLANIYLHELDKWWWERYGNLPATQKAARRRKGQGNVILVRYADDFVLLTNGSKQTAGKRYDNSWQKSSIWSFPWTRRTSPTSAKDSTSWGFTCTTTPDPEGDTKVTNPRYW